jgi:nitrate reductase NapE component
LALEAFSRSSLRSKVVLAFLVASVVFPLLSSPVVDACNACDFQLAWGPAGSGNGQFNAPMGVAADSSYNVCVPIGIW